MSVDVAVEVTTETELIGDLLLTAPELAAIEDIVPPGLFGSRSGIGTSGGIIPLPGWLASPTAWITILIRSSTHGRQAIPEVTAHSMHWVLNGLNWPLGMQE